MKIKDFGVEIYMNKYETQAVYNLAETCVSSFYVEEFLDFLGDKDAIIQKLLEKRLSYGDIEGSQALLEGIASLYNNLSIHNIVPTHGAIGANNMVLNAIVEPGDEIISVIPTYQQLYSIPESIGATVHLLPLTYEDKFLPNLDVLKKMMNPNIKLVCINNPNNPTGAVMDETYLQAIVDIVKPYGSYILCDEVYRGLTHEGNNLTTSIIDLYDKGISTSSMSKTFSLAGIRLGWIAAPDAVIQEVLIHRDYDTISCGVIDDYFATLALQNKSLIFERNLKIVRENVKILTDWVAHDDNYDIIPPKGGTTAFIKMNFDLPSHDFCVNLLNDTGVLVLPGSAMDMEGYIRVGYAYETEALKKGLEIISAYTKTCLAK